MPKFQRGTAGALLASMLCLFVCGCVYFIPGEENNDDVAVGLVPLSGRFGYAFVNGPYNLQGTLTKEELNSPTWQLEGEFTFPTGGYSILAPEIRVAESYPEQVSITLIIQPPPPASLVPEVITQVPVNAEIYASDRSVFNLVVRTRQSRFAQVLRFSSI